jgi:hypothetical protein
MELKKSDVNPFFSFSAVAVGSKKQTFFQFSTEKTFFSWFSFLIQNFTS